MKKIAERILFGNVFTGKDDFWFQGGVALKGNEILAVGTRTELQEYTGENTETEEYPEGLIMAGFGDAHAHFMEGAQLSSTHF